MKVFISYSAEERELAERISFALRSDGHSTFFDRASLVAGRTFDNRIRMAIEDCDLMLFLITPRSIEPGSYARAELAIAESKWPHPDGRILPVMIASTPIDQVAQRRAGGDPLVLSKNG
jgi:TIR domain